MKNVTNPRNLWSNVGTLLAIIIYPAIILTILVFTIIRISPV